MAAVARQVDRVDRLEEVAARMRIHWAEEILLEEMWAKLKRVTELRKWAKQILLQKFSKVIIEKKANIKKRTKKDNSGLRRSFHLRSILPKDIYVRSASCHDPHLERIDLPRAMTPI